MESVLKRDYSEELYNIRKGWDDDIPTDLKLVLGPLACGAAVVGNSEIVDDMIKQHSRKTVGLDMESYGMFYATNYGLDSGTIPICLKSISDFADEKRRWISKICGIYKRRICKVFDRVCFTLHKWIVEKSHLLNCRCDTLVYITSPTQLQDGTTYDSSNVIHHICMKSNKKLFR